MTALPPLAFEVDELRSHLRVDDPGETFAIVAAGRAGQEYVESVTGARMTPRSEIVTLSAWPAAGDWFAIAALPVLAVSSIDYVPLGASAAVSLAPTVWQFRNSGLHGQEGEIRLRTGQSWPALEPDSDVIVTLQTGYPLGLCPAPLRTAALLMAGHFYENRGPVVIGTIQASLQYSVNDLIANFRTRWTA